MTHSVSRVRPATLPDTLVRECRSLVKTVTYTITGRPPTEDIQTRLIAAYASGSRYAPLVQITTTDGLLMRRVILGKRVPNPDDPSDNSLVFEGTIANGEDFAHVLISLSGKVGGKLRLL